MVLLAWAVGLGTALSTAPARADDDRVDRMGTELRNNEDFRVRTQAALALGASKDKRAVAALCDGLDDSITTVRAAAAAALGKLALGGKKCLETHIDSETNESVKTVLQKALDKVKGGSKPALASDTKYYVAIGPTTDKSGRDGTAVDDLVHEAMEGAVSELEGCVIAPRDEKPTDAKSLLAKHKNVKAFFLWPKVMPPDYSGGNLTVRFEIAIFTYPGKALKGTIPLKLTMPDVSGTDRGSEDDLIKQAAQSAFKRFSGNAERLGE
ncbi:MAG TPA: HEAT repeat domain-containing protein [Polyangiaceae bacterium]|nr:HEAT repeat domain-containing protein [Polyangiaceae bacterium]